MITLGGRSRRVFAALWLASSLTFSVAAGADASGAPSSLQRCQVVLSGLLDLTGRIQGPSSATAGGVVTLTPAQQVAVANYIGAPVVGGYANGGRAKPAFLDVYGDIRGPDGRLAPTFSVLKKILGSEIEGNATFSIAAEDAVSALRSRPSLRPFRDSDVAAAVEALSPKARRDLEAKGVSPTAAVANLVALRSAMTRLTGPVVRGVLSTEVGFADRLPQPGDAIPFSSARGAVMSTNPATSVADSIAYGLGKIARMKDGDADKARAKVLILEYSALDVEGVAVESLGTKAIDTLEAHLKTGNRSSGDTFLDPTVVVSRNEVIASPKQDLVVLSVARDPEHPNVYRVKMGPKRLANR